MINKAAFFEYGLVVPVEKIPKGKCKLCDSPFIIHPIRDWVYCSNCSYGFSRLKLVDPTWFKGLSESEIILLNAYYQNVLQKADNFLGLWKSLKGGDELNYLMTGLSALEEWVKLVDSQDQVEALMNLQLGLKGLPKPPFALIKLEDLPGRVTGVVVLKRKTGGDFRSIYGTLREGQQIAFLSGKTTVVMDCFTTVINGLLYERIVGGPLPPVAWIHKEDKQFPGNFLLATGELTRDRVNLIVNSKLKTWINDRASKSRMRLPDWVEKATRQASDWYNELARGLVKVGANQASALLNLSDIKGESLNKVLENLDPEFRMTLMPAVRGKVTTHRLPGNKVVVNSGKNWTDLSGRIVLSANLVIRKVEKINGRVNYHLELIHEDWSFQFQSGLAMERNSMDVIFRECLLQDKMIEFDRRYSKFVLELAARLNPQRPEDFEQPPQTQLRL